MSRHLADVARQIRNVIPDEFKVKIDRCIKDAAYKPPEQQGECFRILSMLCNDILEGEYPPVTPWKIKMIEILIDEKLPTYLQE